MMETQPAPERLFQKDSATLQKLIVAESIATVVGVFVAAAHAGFLSSSAVRQAELNWLVFGAMFLIAGSRTWRFFKLTTRRSLFGRLLEAQMILPLLWFVGMLVLWQLNVFAFKGRYFVGWSDMVVSITALVGVLLMCRRLAATTRNSAVLLIGSFAVIITLGTLLLMLPACRPALADGTRQSASWNVALFTATSATCVTGLIVEPTGSYWSPLGHAVIFSLFQIGGLGILTFGAFIAVLTGRKGLQFREAGTLSEMLDSESVNNVRRILLTILTFTIAIEAIGAISLMGLYGHLPLRQQIWHAVFHSVSAFCNAGFSLNDDGFLNMGVHWQVWGPLTILIILGGLGFPVVNDVANKFRALFARRRNPKFHCSTPSPRLTVHSRLVLITTVVLLVSGAAGWFVLETLNAEPNSSAYRRVADAWFQSVTFRTAGFNTVDHQMMQPATKLLAIFLMFIGAAPGSTGGGVKTLVFAVTMLNVWSVIRGRNRVEVFGRRIPAAQVARSLAMIAVGILIILLTTGLLVIFEQNSDRFLDHLFEATSAFGTAGVSAGITGGLTLPSQMLICLVMFLGRVGPITLLLAMAAEDGGARYDYPEERVSLG